MKLRIKDFREYSNLTQKELANKLNITQAAVSAYELGIRQPDFETLEKMATIFNTSIDLLLGRNNELVEHYQNEINKSLEYFEMGITILKELKKHILSRENTIIEYRQDRQCVPKKQFRETIESTQDKNIVYSNEQGKEKI